MGLIGAVELVKDKQKREHFANVGQVGTICRDHCFKHNVILRAVRDGMVFAPPLIITEEEIDEMMRRFRICLDLTAKDVGMM